MTEMEAETFGTGEMKSPECKSMLGPQYLSTKPTQPSFGFGTATRESTSKVFLSRKAKTDHIGKASPGPVYNLKSSVGKQIQSHCESAPAFMFGKRHTKGGEENQKAPGPGKYEMPSSIGKQAMSSKSNSEKWRFPTANRWSNTKKDFSDHFGTPAARDFKPANGWLGDSAKFSFSGEAKRYDVGKGSPGVEPSFLKAPGPGTYESKSSLGTQPETKKKTSQQVKFGTSVRGSNKVYVSRQHEREVLGHQSPGPNMYILPNSVGPQISSKNKSAPSTRFGSSDRFSDIKSHNKRDEIPKVNPGPGSYAI